jgi:hypothetical protein
MQRNHAVFSSTRMGKARSLHVFIAKVRPIKVTDRRGLSAWTTAGELGCLGTSLLRALVLRSSELGDEGRDLIVLLQYALAIRGSGSDYCIRGISPTGRKKISYRRSGVKFFTSL